MCRDVGCLSPLDITQGGGSSIHRYVDTHGLGYLGMLSVAALISRFRFQVCLPLVVLFL